MTLLLTYKIGKVNHILYGCQQDYSDWMVSANA